MNIPVENQRVKELIKYYCDGNELQFSKEIGVSQPRINRLFSKDSRNGKYPLVSFEIIQAIKNKFIKIDLDWLVTGNGEMHKKDHISNIPIQIDNSEVVSLLKETNKLKDDKIYYLEKENADLKKQISDLKKEQKQDSYYPRVAEERTELK